MAARQWAAVCIALLTPIIGACATVRSYPTQDYQLQRSSAGFTYFLPMRMMRLTATRTPLRIEDLTRNKAQKESALVTARSAFDAAKGRREVAEAILAALGPNVSPDTRSEQQQALEVLRAEERVAQANITSVEVSLREVTAALDALQLGGAACSYTAKLELLPAQADPDRRFIAAIAHSPLRDDSVALAVSPSGLLTSTNVISTDRTADIIVELAGAISGMGGSRAMTRDGSPPVACATLPRQFVRIFDPLAGWSAAPNSAPATGFSLPAIDLLNGELATAKFPVRIVPDMRALIEPDVTAGNQRPRLRGTPDYRRYEGAIYYRSPVPMTFAIEQDSSVGWQPVDAAIVMLPQAGPVSYVPMNSSAFVRTVDDVRFVDGSIASWNAERPSEVLEIVRLPVRVLTAIMTVPGQIISLRVNQDTSERNLAESQRQQMQTAARMRELQACIQRAEAEDVSSLPCFQAQ